MRYLCRSQGSAPRDDMPALEIIGEMPCQLRRPFEPATVKRARYRAGLMYRGLKLAATVCTRRSRIEDSAKTLRGIGASRHYWETAFRPQRPFGPRPAIDQK